MRVNHRMGRAMSHRGEVRKLPLNLEDFFGIAFLNWG